MTRKEELYITAIKNMVRKNECFNLQDSLEKGVITEEEFEKEIDNNPDKYVINISYYTNKKDEKLITQIVNELGYTNLDYSDVSDLFGIDLLRKKPK